MRIDTPHTSIITDPAGQQTIMLDHLKKEALVMPTPPAPGPAPAGSPPMPVGSPPPPMQVHDLGKTLIEGHEVEGKRYTLPPLPPPPKPTMPAMPKMPQLSKPPNPQPPQPPKPPQLRKLPKPTVAEVWTSVKLKTPVLTKVTSSAGEQTTYCKPTSTEEPHPSVFQIPPGYKVKKP